jgi:hypothetical protein
MRRAIAVLLLAACGGPTQQPQQQAIVTSEWRPVATPTSAAGASQSDDGAIPVAIDLFFCWRRDEDQGECLFSMESCDASRARDESHGGPPPGACQPSLVAACFVATDALSKARKTLCFPNFLSCEVMKKALSNLNPIDFAFTGCNGFRAAGAS